LKRSVIVLYETRVCVQDSFIEQSVRHFYHRLRVKRGVKVFYAHFSFKVSASEKKKFIR
jgi:hypothetical protein